MIRLERRALLKAGAALAPAAALPGAALAAGRARLVVHDSRLPESRQFAAAQAGHRIDLAPAHETRWAALRGALPDAATVEGLTRWSDWVIVRGELQARGFRVTSEHIATAPISRHDRLWRWSMTRRA